VGAEETFERDTEDLDRLRGTLLRQADRVASELRDEGLRGRTVTLKLRFADFRTLTRRDTTAAPTADGAEIFHRAWAAFTRLPRSQPIRLIGISVSGLMRDAEGRQLGLFGRAEHGERIGRLADELRARFGPDAVRRASLLVPLRRKPL
jgi:DNA polymerase-4